MYSDKEFILTEDLQNFNVVRRLLLIVYAEKSILRNNKQIQLKRTTLLCWLRIIGLEGQ